MGADTVTFMSLMGKLRTDRFAKKESRTLHVLGIALFLVSFLMIFPIIASVISDEDNFMYLLIPMLIGLGISLFLIFYFKNPKTMRPTDGLVMIFVLWSVLFIFGMLPYLLCGVNFFDALFESVSGFTTTGATAFEDIETLPTGLLVWRSLSQWIGGIIIVIMFMFIIPIVVAGGRGVLQNEMSGSGSGNMYMKMGKAAKQYIGVYVALTLIFFLILLLLTGSAVSAGSIALSVVCTGGFSLTNSSFADADVLLKIVVMIFMLISATNFYLLFRAVVKREFKGFGRSEEFKTMVIWLGSISVLICMIIFISNTAPTASPVDTIVDVFFSVISLGTTTGYTTLNYTEAWPYIGASLLLIIMFIGGSSGSTSGGIKISRAVLILKAMGNELKRFVHPNAVFGVKFDKNGVDDGVVHSATVVAMIFAITILISTLVFDTILDLGDSFFTSMALITGTGPGLGELFGSYQTLPEWAKIFACFLMFLGRMEIVTVLTVLTPGFWKEVLGLHRFSWIRRGFSFRKKHNSDQID